MSTTNLLNRLNQEYILVHKTYEDLFRQTYMWDHSVDDQFNKAQTEFENFKTEEINLIKIQKQINLETNNDLKTRLQHRERFFQLHQTPNKLKPLKAKINKLENQVQQKMANHKEWYIDPKTKRFVEASNSKMRLLISTENNEELRKACFDGRQNTAADFVEDLVLLIKMRNQYAQQIWYQNFYEYKAQTEEQMTSKEIFTIFDDLTTKLKTKHKVIREMEQTNPKIRQPRNFPYIMAWDFTQEEDQYLPIEKMIERRGKSFTSRNIDYNWAELQLDLLERKGKYNNWFCHQPTPNYTHNSKQNIWQTNFTCTAIPGQIWSWNDTWNTLFHEGWHAAHFSNMTQLDTILNTEYIPASTARAETQSMFLDEAFSSIERKTRYATNNKWEKYPFQLYQKIVNKLQPIAGRGILGIASVVKFEEILYNTPSEQINAKLIINLAKQLSIEFFDFSEPSLFILTVPHIYSRSSSAYYHGYGMATLALHQRKEYFENKYGYIIDNPHIWPEMTKMRRLWSSKSFQELVKLATWKELSSKAYLNNIMMSSEAKIKKSIQNIQKLEKIPKFSWKVQLNASIKIVEWPKVVASNAKDFQTLCQEYETFIQTKIKQN